MIRNGIITHGRAHFEFHLGTGIIMVTPWSGIANAMVSSHILHKIIVDQSDEILPVHLGRNCNRAVLDKYANYTNTIIP